MKLNLSRSGFTLIEIVVSVAIIGIIAYAVAPTLISTVQQFGLVSNRRLALTDAKAAMDRMVIEMRQISNTAGISSCSTPSAFTFSIPSESNIAYSLSGTDLMRGAVQLAQNVSSLTFVCYDSNGLATSVVANAKRIGIEMVVSPPNYGTLRLRTQAFPRRFATNYAGYQ